MKMKLIEIDSDDDLEVNKGTTKENSTFQPDGLVGEGLLGSSKMSHMPIEVDLNTPCELVEWHVNW